MPLYLYFIIILFVQLVIARWFYREDKYFALLIAFFVNVFAFSVVGIIAGFDVNNILLGLLLLLIVCIGYGIFLKGGYKKGLIVSLVANVVSIGFAFLLMKILHDI